MSRALTEHISSSFREDAPRPPVPGEEGEGSCCNPGRSAKMRTQSKVKDAAGCAAAAPPGSTPRRNEDGLGEPEGSASPDSPLVRWTKSLHFLLGDQDGAHLFKTFLERENCVDTLDFWFACNGFRQMDLKDTKTLRVAKVIFKRYIETNSIVAKQLKPATKTFIRDNIKKQQIDSAMFDQAQTEIQSYMEENAYQMFLTSDIYLEYVRTGCENAAYMNHGGLGSLKLMCGYLPPLMEEEEWSCSDLKAKTLGSVVGLSAKNLRATATIRTAAEVLENSYRSHRRGDPASPYFVNSGYIFAPATSANDSEISSDATTDDSMSMTDSSVDGVPPYKLGTKKQLQRDMHRSVKINGQVTLPHFPRTHRLPKEMTPVEPSAFAAQLIAKLEKLKREQDTMSSLEERLQQIQEEDEREESNDLSSGTSLHHPLLPSGSQCEEDPQAILDEHLSRVLKTPGCQSPGVVRHSPRSHSPDRTGTLVSSGHGPFFGAYHGTTKVLMAGRQPTKHIHHHYIHHHHAGPKTKEQIETEAARRVQCLCPQEGANYSDFTPARCSTLSRRPVKACDEGVCSPCLPLVSTDRSQNVWQWILESERQGKHKPHSSSQGLKKSNPLDSKILPARTNSSSWGGGGIGNGAQFRGHHPGHPFIQDPAMPPLPPPNTLQQLEEACRRLEEVSKPPKQRHSTAASSLQRDRSHPAVAFPAGGSSLPGPGLQPDESKELVVTYFFCGEEIPYRSMMKTHCLTLGHFKEQLSKKGNYRYYFKKASDEFECGAVFEEVWEDATVLPMYEGKVLGKVERMD
ncbi:axin-2-like isoform 1-T1 [Xenentodon cancila]